MAAHGGSGGTASATILGTVILNGSAGVGQTSGQAVLVQANGGGGGQGGNTERGDQATPVAADLRAPAVARP